MRKLRNLLILCAAASGLAGCAWRNLGPCYGVGCPAWSSSGAQQKSASVNPPAEAPKAVAAQAPPSQTTQAGKTNGQ